MYQGHLRTLVFDKVMLLVLIINTHYLWICSAFAGFPYGGVPEKGLFAISVYIEQVVVTKSL